MYMCERTFLRALDAMKMWKGLYLCFNIYKGWMKSKSQVCGSSKEVSAKRNRDKDEVEDVDEDSE